MESLIDEGEPAGNVPEFSVSELSGAVKRTVESEFGHVRVRGEVGRVSRPRSGHIYLDLKDDRAVLAGVIWKGVASRLTAEPEEGLEVVATGRLTTFPGQSKYQIVIEDLAPAGVGALMAMLEKRKAALTAEGLFEAARKKPLPFLPHVIGVVTSPSGAVIRDILHRLAERFPVRVLVWPVAVQGAKCAPEVAGAIRGFSAMQGANRPDVVMVARGGGSVEDLWGFNEEIVVRAAADSDIPLISGVGHETDHTLVDLAADRRAPTPTAAAEMAVPVRAELIATVADLEARRLRSLRHDLDRRRQRLSDLTRALPKPEHILAERRQRLDLATSRLPSARDLLDRRQVILRQASAALRPALRHHAQTARQRLTETVSGLRFAVLNDRIVQRGDHLAAWGQRLTPAARRHLGGARDRVAALARTLGAFSYKQTLARGYAVIRDGSGSVIAASTALPPDGALEIEFSDGRVAARTGGQPPQPLAAPPAKRKKKRDANEPGNGQGSLF